MSTPVSAAIPYNRESELRALDATTSGVRGLVASGVTELPLIFRIPDPETQNKHEAAIADDQDEALPVIDLSMGDHKALVDAVLHVASEWGFFQVTGHGVPVEVTSGTMDGLRAFHESDSGEGTEKTRLYSRDPAKKVKYNCNHDLYRSKVASWRDTLQLHMAPDPPAPSELPEQCRDMLLEYSKQMANLYHTLFGLLSEALGLNPSYLTDMDCNHSRIFACHYYPPCPQPELAIGIVPHSDSGFLTVVLQDDVGGLEILRNDKWIEVKPVPGAFIVNIGDLLQIISNDKFKSVKHKVVPKNATPRVSIVCFTMNPASKRIYGPIKELLSEENPPLFNDIAAGDYFALYHSKLGLDDSKNKTLDYLRCM